MFLLPSFSIVVTFSVAIITEKSYGVGSILQFWKTPFDKLSWFLTIQLHPYSYGQKNQFQAFLVSRNFPLKWTHEKNWFRVISYFHCLSCFFEASSIGSRSKLPKFWSCTTPQTVPLENCLQERQVVKQSAPLPTPAAPPSQAGQRLYSCCFTLRWRPSDLV